MYIFIPHDRLRHRIGKKGKEKEKPIDMRHEILDNVGWRSLKCYCKGQSLELTNQNQLYSFINHFGEYRIRHIFTNPKLISHSLCSLLIESLNFIQIIILQIIRLLLLELFFILTKTRWLWWPNLGLVAESVETFLIVWSDLTTGTPHETNLSKVKYIIYFITEFHCICESRCLKEEGSASCDWLIWLLLVVHFTNLHYICQKLMKIEIQYEILLFQVSCFFCSM
jgi:hypothetical protein